MARCTRCKKYMLFSSQSGFCNDCESVIKRENEIRRENEEKLKHKQQEAQQKAEAERIRHHQEAFENKTLSKEEFDALGDIIQKRYLQLIEKSGQIVSSIDTILSQPKQKIIYCQ